MNVFFTGDRISLQEAEYLLDNLFLIQLNLEVVQAFKRTDKMLFYVREASSYNNIIINIVPYSNFEMCIQIGNLRTDQYYMVINVNPNRIFLALSEKIYSSAFINCTEAQLDELILQKIKEIDSLKE